MSPRPTKQKSTQEYCESLAGDVVTKGLRITFGDTKNISLSPTNMFEIPLYIESDGRIKNRVYTMLKSLGVLDSFNYTQHDRYSNYSSRREGKQYYGIVNPKWFNKNAPGMAKAPVFQTSGRITVKKNTWDNSTETKILKEEDNYRILFGDLSDAEMIYVYYHLNEYDVQVKEYVNGNSGRLGYHGTGKHTKHRIYPKALLPMLSKGVFHGHAVDYLNKHFEWVMVNVLGIKDDRIINNISVSGMPLPTYTFREMSNWNVEFLDEQLSLLTEIRNVLNTGEQALLRLKETVNKFGGWDKIKAVSEKAFIKYLEECFPLHIGDNEEDEDLKKLCIEVQEGKNKGFNDRFQELSLKKEK